MSEHLAGRPVSVGTYRNFGCRCDGCRDASRIRVARDRGRNGLPPSHKVHLAARNKAATWLVEHRPDVWAQLLAEAYAATGTERKPVGRPRKAAS